MQLDFKIYIAAIQASFRKLQELGKSDGLTRKIANVLRDESESAFDNERTPEGESWAGLNPQYKKRRYEKGYTGKTLHVTGDLINSLNVDYGDNFAMVGVSEPYGKFHQEGTTKMPARPFLGLGEDGIDEIKNILEKALKNAIDEIKWEMCKMIAVLFFKRSESDLNAP